MSWLLLIPLGVLFGLNQLWWYAVAQRDYFIGRADEYDGVPLPPANKRLGSARKWPTGTRTYHGYRI